MSPLAREVTGEGNREFSSGVPYASYCGCVFELFKLNPDIFLSSTTILIFQSMGALHQEVIYPFDVPVLFGH